MPKFHECTTAPSIACIRRNDERAASGTTGYGMHNDHHHQRHGGKQPSAQASGREGGPATRRAGMDGFDEERYRSAYRDASYYSTGRNWRDYAPAYRYGHAARAAHAGQRFEDVEAELAASWDALKADSRLLWVEARGAVHDAWQHFDAGFRADRQRRRHD